MKKFFLTFMALFLMPFCSFAQEITVAAASNVQYALQELKADFEKETDIKLKMILGSSGKLTSQIVNGAPFDIFISADMDSPAALHKESLALESPQIYAYGTLVFWTFKSLDLSKGIKIAADPSVEKIAIANPQTAPYGRQALNALQHSHLYENVEDKLVYGENIAQVNQFIVTEAVDAGFTAKSIVLAPNFKGKGTWIELEPDSYDPIAQGAVILKYARKHLKEAKAFYDFLFSAKAREIFKRYGYQLP